jgi:hypothetical protein
MIKEKRIMKHPAIKGNVYPAGTNKESINHPISTGIPTLVRNVSKEDNQLIDQIVKKLHYCLLEPITAKLSGGSSLFMERIIGSTHYLSNNRKMIYDVCFADLYLHDGRIPQNHLAIENMLLKVEDWCHIDNADKFLMILSKENESPKGMQFFIDDVLYISNVPFSKSESMRNELLRLRNDGIIDYFSVLKVKDPSGNITEFHTKLDKTKIEARRKELLETKKQLNVRS